MASEETSLAHVRAIAARIAAYGRSAPPAELIQSLEDQVSQARAYEPSIDALAYAARLSPTRVAQILTEAPVVHPRDEHGRVTWHLTVSN